MDRQAVIEATIDYVMTKLARNRSVGPAWIRYQEREVHEDVTGAKSFNQAARQAIKKPAAGTFKPKWDQNKRQPIKPLPRHRSMTEVSMREEANLKVTRKERIGPNLWQTKKPKAKVLKFKPKSKSKNVHSRAELIDKLTKKQVATKGKVKQVATQLPSYVAARKKSPQHPVHKELSLGTYLSKHGVTRDLAREARGKSRLPENKMTRDELIEMLLEAERVTLDSIYKARGQRCDAGRRNARDVKRIASGLNMKNPKMRKYAKALYKDYV